MIATELEIFKTVNGFASEKRSTRATSGERLRSTSTDKLVWTSTSGPRGNEFLVEVDQNYYVEGLMDLNIAWERLKRTDNPQLTPDEVSACRAGLGAVQWAATPTQVQACARANLLLSQITSNHDMNTAKEIQEHSRSSFQSS